MVVPKWDTDGGAEAPATQATESGPGTTAPGTTPGPAEQAGVPVLDETTPVAPDAGSPESDKTGETDPWVLLTEISVAVRQLADSSDRYHLRAEQREAVIDHQRDEVDRLRRGERRGLLRPLLVETCRLRNDLLRQAGDLPADFDADRAALLLRSYAESVEITLENSGVRTFAPEPGDSFDPRMHRRVGGEPAKDPALAGRVANVVRDGYLDVDSASPLAPAKVVVFGHPAATASAATRTDDRSES